MERIAIDPALPLTPSSEPSRFQFSDFDTAHFRAQPRRTVLGDWIVEHLSFGTAGTAARTPIVFLGGAFQNAWSFYREVKHFLPQRPIFIVDLPGQGQNAQLSPDLGFADFASLLRRFLDEQGIARIIPVGLSYGSGMAFRFAQMFPERVERCILGVTTPRIRPRVEKALRTGFWYLERGRHDMFADGVLHHLLNLPMRGQTGATARLVEALRMGMLELTDAERLRYRHNTERLLRDWFDGSLSCPTLIYTARHDSFTTPSEGLELARRCAQAEFVMFEQGDHLAPVEHPRTAIAIYDAYVNGNPVAAVPGVITGEAAEQSCVERRILERRPGRGREVTLRDVEGRESRASLLDYNAHGCLLALGDSTLAARAEPVRVTIPSINADGDAILMEDERGARAVFLHDAFGTLGTAPVMTVEMPIPSSTQSGAHRRSVAERLLAIPDDVV